MVGLLKGSIFCNSYPESFSGFIHLMLLQMQLKVEEVRGSISTGDKMCVSDG